MRLRIVYRDEDSIEVNIDKTNEVQNVSDALKYVSKCNPDELAVIKTTKGAITFLVSAVKYIIGIDEE